LRIEIYTYYSANDVVDTNIKKSIFVVNQNKEANMAEYAMESKCPYCGQMMPYGGCRDFDAAEVCTQNPDYQEPPEESRSERTC
jgi:hypothetical protein